LKVNNRLAGRPACRFVFIFSCREHVEAFATRSFRFDKFPEVFTSG
jgi:hypothetical protein